MLIPLEIVQIHSHLGLQLWGYEFISDYKFKPLWQIFSIDSNVNLCYDNDFLCQFFQ